MLFTCGMRLTKTPYNRWKRKGGQGIFSHVLAGLAGEHSMEDWHDRRGLPEGTPDSAGLTVKKGQRRRLINGIKGNTRLYPRLRATPGAGQILKAPLQGAQSDQAHVWRTGTGSAWRHDITAVPTPALSHHLRRDRYIHTTI